MATLLHLSNAGHLVKYDPALPHRQQENRLVYLRPKAKDWFDNDLPELEGEGSEISPMEEVDAFLADFCSGEVLTFDRQIHPMRHIASGVWELKTRAIRLFGMFHAKDCFVCTSGALATQVKRQGLYENYRDAAVDFINELDLDEPKFIESGDPNDVVSAFCYP